jgi:hypothetical protein
VDGGLRQHGLREFQPLLYIGDVTLAPIPVTHAECFIPLGRSWIATMHLSESLQRPEREQVTVVLHDVRNRLVTKDDPITRVVRNRFCGGMPAEKNDRMGR